MSELVTIYLKSQYDVIAPDGSEIRLLPRTEGGSMAHVRLKVGQVSLPVAHKTVEEIWYVLSGHGEMWRKQGDNEDVTNLRSGCSVTIPVGTHFQFRNIGNTPLDIVLVTMPPWPGADEAYHVPGYWTVNKPQASE